LPKPRAADPVHREGIELSFDRKLLPYLRALPWNLPLEEWADAGVNFLQIKSGLSRHVVRFVKVRGKAFAVKETSGEAALREFDAYKRLHVLGVPTLQPAGTVMRDEGMASVTTEAGIQFERHTTGYLVTQLLEFAIPDYFLFRRAFTKTNRKRIWESIIRLFVLLHSKGVYWGDPSLSNMMIVFGKEHIPGLGVRTVLRAVLADAETVELYPKLSEKMRMSDVEFLFESMAWTEADLMSSGILREPLMTKEDQQYFLRRYRDLMTIEEEEEKFVLITKIDADSLIGPFQAPGQSKALLQHIYEHKWYMSERDKREVSIEDAALDWYLTIFKPVIDIFNKHSVLDEFPDRTAASLYLDIMLHKYYLSERMGRDIGVVAAFESYSKKFKDRSGAMEKLMDLARSVEELFRK
jgi:hypothetical protein